MRGEFGGFFDCVLGWVVSGGIGRGREGRGIGGRRTDAFDGRGFGVELGVGRHSGDWVGVMVVGWFVEGVKRGLRWIILVIEYINMLLIGGG